MKVLVGVDIGTQGTKAAAFDEAGKCLGQAFCSSKLHRPKPGVVEEDPEVQFTSVCTTIRECLKTANVDRRSVEGIGLDGQMAGILGIGYDGHHVTPYDSWLDTRCSRYIEEMDRTAGDEILAKTGGPPSFNHGPKILWWQRQRKQTFRRIAAFVQPGGYVAMRLCGLGADEAFIDKSYLHFSGFADNQKACWDTELCRQFHLDQEVLPRIVSSHQVIGQVTASAARRCGLAAGVPVVAGCGDTTASFLAAGATAEGIGVDVAGTASVFAMTTSRFKADRKHRTLVCGQSAVPGLWHTYAYINGGGMNLQWFRDNFASTDGVNGNNVSLKELDTLAATVPPRNDLPLFVPHLAGRVCPAQPQLRGAWVGLTWNHTTAHLYRAILESVALEYGIYQKVLAGLHRQLKVKEVRVTGGGEQSALWNSIKANVIQRSFRRVVRSEGAPLGAALLAGWGVGVLTNLPEAARQWIPLEESTRPKRRLATLYAERLARYEDILNRLS